MKDQGLKYLSRTFTRQQLDELLQLGDLALGAIESPYNPVELGVKMKDTKPMKLCMNLLGKDADSTRVIEEKKRVGPFSKEELLQMPSGSLGRTYAAVTDAIGADLDWYPDLNYFNNQKDPEDYVIYRMSATHDLHHIITGFSPDPFGELGVISVSLSQNNYPVSGFVPLLALLTTWLNSEIPEDDLPSAETKVFSTTYTWRIINKGIEMGLQARPLFPFDWESHLEENIDEVRNQLGINAVKEGLWSYYSNPIISKRLCEIG